MGTNRYSQSEMKRFGSSRSASSGVPVLGASVSMPMSAPTPVVLMTSKRTPRSMNSSMTPDISVMAGAVPLSTMPMGVGEMGMAHLSGGRAGSGRCRRVGLHQRDRHLLGLGEIPRHRHLAKHAGRLGRAGARLLDPIPSREQA